jgi:hypothetical protein
MKNAIRDLFFGKGAALSLAIAIGVFFVVGFACNVDTNTSSTSDNKAPATGNTGDSGSSTTSDASRGDVPSDAELQTLVRSTVLDFNEAIQSDDFGDFHENLAKPFKKQVSAEKLAGVFHEFVENKLDFSDVKDLKATFNPAPAIEKDAGFTVLHTKGIYPTTPRKTNFDLKYIKEDGEWKLSSIEINTKDQ